MEKNLSGSLRGAIDEMLEGSVAGNISFSSGGGSNVTITPTLSEGTKVADYTIDGSEGVLYAPTPTEYEAGNNITIENGVINATDTKYTAGANIQISENNVISASGGGVNYSTEEQVIGTWIDGKPIYQRTFSGNYNLTNSWYDTGEVIPNGIIVKAEAVVYETDGNCISVLGNISPNGNIYLFSLRPSTTYNVNYFTIWYTKTTDAVGNE